MDWTVFDTWIIRRTNIRRGEVRSVLSNASMAEKLMNYKEGIKENPGASGVCKQYLNSHNYIIIIIRLS